jgi:hypothetical protein
LGVLEARGRIIYIIMDLREIGHDIVGWIHLAHTRDQWLALVNMLNNLLCSLKDGIS